MKFVCGVNVHFSSSASTLWVFFSNFSIMFFSCIGRVYRNKGLKKMVTYIVESHAGVDELLFVEGLLEHF